MKVSIIIPILKPNIYYDTLVKSLSNKIKSDYEVIILDGLEGVNEKWNNGVYQSEGDYLFIINDDIVLTEGLDKQLIDLLEYCKVACPYTTSGPNNWELPMFQKEENIAGWCFMMKRDDWMPIPPELDIYYGDDWIFHTQNKDIGFIGKVHHYESKSLTDPEVKDQIQLRIMQDNVNWEKVKLANNFK